MGFPLLLNKALAGAKNHGLGVCTKWTLLGHIHSGQVGFPLLLKKTLTWGQETWIWAFYKWHSFEEGMFRVGKWAFPCY